MDNVHGDSSVSNELQDTQDIGTAVSSGKKAGAVCAIATCPNSFSTDGISLHAFPTEEELRKKWTHLCRRKDWQPGPGARVCSDHFSPNDYRGTKRKLLNPAAFPSRFECLPSRTLPTARPSRQAPKNRCQPSLPCTEASPSEQCLVLQKALDDANWKLLELNRTIASYAKVVSNLEIEQGAISREKEQLVNNLEAKMDTERKGWSSERAALLAAIEKEKQSIDSKVSATIFQAKKGEHELRAKIHQLDMENQRLRSDMDSRLHILRSESENAIKERDDTIRELKKRMSQQEFRVEKFADKDAAIQKLTGIPSYAILRALFFDYLDGKNQDFVHRIQYRRHGASNSYPDRGRAGCAQPALDYFNQFFMSLIKLRVGMTEDTLGAIFDISVSTVSDYYTTWISVMNERFKMLFRRWPEEYVFAPQPDPIYEWYPNLTCIVDCFEIEIQRPRNPDAQRRCYSNYKKCTTIKVFVAIEPNGNFCFVSHIYQGSISDVEIVKRCGFLDNLKPGSVVLADRGFQMKELAAARDILWIVPPSVVGNIGLSEIELQLTYRIARVRIHVERAIGRLKTFREMDGPVSIKSLQRKDMEIQVVSHLCKFLPPLVSGTKETAPEDVSMGEGNVTHPLDLMELLENEGEIFDVDF